jgi:hypothetical protein
MNSKAIIQILDHLGSEYSKKWSEDEKDTKIKTWSTILNDVTDEQGMVGLRKALESPSEFMPSVGKFKQMCLSGSGCQSLEDEALQAWAIVIKNLNSSISPVFKDSAIAEAIRKMGGWKRLCGMTIFPPEKSEEPFRKKDFVDLYAVARRKKEEFNPMLKGLNEFFIDGEFRPQYRFIGYDPGADKKAVLAQIEQKENTDKKMLAMIMEGVK